MSELININLPVSKSIANRLMVIAALRGERLPRWRSECEDIADIRNSLEEGMAKGICHVKESGTALRFLIAFFSISKKEGETTEICCSGRLAERPIEGLIEALVGLGMKTPEIEIRDGVKIIRIVSSHLQGGDANVSTEITSQYASALLLIAPYLSKGLCMRGKFGEKPYVQMTVKLMQRFGARIDQSEDKIMVYPSGYNNFSIGGSEEADWSASSFFYEFAALNPGKILMKGLNPLTTLQGDGKELPWMFYDLGVTTDEEDEGVRIEGGKEKAIWIRKNISSYPDLVIPFVVTCCFLGVQFRISGIEGLRHKESDRIEALKRAMAQMGFVIEEEQKEEGLCLKWRKEKCEALPVGSEIDDAYDHRIAMAIEACNRGYRARHPECVRKSFPDFYKELAKLRKEI